MKRSPRLLLVLSFLVCAHLGLRAQDVTPSITTVGVAEHRYPADRVNIFVNIEAVRPTSAEASAETTAVHEALLQALQQAGVAANDLRLITRSTGRRTRWSNEKDEDIYLGQFCSERLRLVVRDLTRLETITTTLANFQAVNVGGMSFESDREGEEKRAALLAAAKAAEEKARALAAASGVRITGVLEIEEQAGTFDFYNVAGNSTRTTEPRDGLTELSITVTVRARYGIEPAAPNHP